MGKLKDLAQCKHPNSRKTLALTKQAKKLSVRKKVKLSQNIKQNLIGEKLTWFRDNITEIQNVCTPDQIENLIRKYLSRFDDELEQIQIKHSVGNRKNRQHASREDMIKMTVKREYDEFHTGGIEVPDLLNANQVEMLKNWNGELRYLPNFKLQRVSKQKLDELRQKNI